MFDLLKLCVACITLVMIALPVTLVVALSLPRNSELRLMCMRCCYWGVALVAVAYCATPIDALPELLLGPVGFCDDAIALGIGVLSARKALQFGRSAN